MGPGMWDSALWFLLLQAQPPHAHKGDGRCNKDDTHRVCAKIGESSTSFFSFTGQSNVSLMIHLGAFG